MEDKQKFKELAVISTCNRTEIYAVLPEPGHFFEWVYEKYKQFKQVDLKTGSADPTILYNLHAIEHLFSVAGGLKSMMLGENQILSQVKSSHDLILSLPYSFPILNRLFQDAIRVGKSVRTNTNLCKGAVSISLAAAELTRKIYANFSKLKVMLVGAGETAELTAIHLREMGVTDFIIANRGESRRNLLAEKFNASAIPLDKIPSFLTEVDIVIAATKSKEYLLTYQMIKDSQSKRSQSSILIIDISSPRNVDPKSSDLPQVYLYNINDLEKVVSENLDKRKKELPAANEIVREIASEFREWFKTLEVVPTISQLNGYFEHIRNQELNKFRYKTTEQEFQKMEDLSRKIIRKLLHYPILELREQNINGNLTVSKIDALWDLYRLKNFKKSKE
ncbi:MAG: glutamyl-tRNA reductase, partial [Fidelibacterota bacterium]